MPLEIKRQWHVNINSLISLIVLIGLIFIWQNELQSLAISIVAFGVAIVVATKEVWMCLTGGIYRGMVNTFKIGDRIEIDGIRGDVLNKTFLATTLLEIGPGDLTQQYTGRSIILPNNIFLNHKLINESFLKSYVLHTFRIPLETGDIWIKAEELLFKITDEVCSPYFDEAKKHFLSLEKKLQVSAPDWKPRIHLAAVSSKENHLIVRVAVPAIEKGQLQQKIIKKLFMALSEYKKGEI